MFAGVWIGALEFYLDQELSLFSERVFHHNTERFKCARVLIENSSESCLGNNSRRNCDIVHTLLSDFDKRNFKLWFCWCIRYTNNAWGDPFDLVWWVKYLTNVRCNSFTLTKLESNCPLNLRSISFHQRNAFTTVTNSIWLRIYFNHAVSSRLLFP